MGFNSEGVAIKEGLNFDSDKTQKIVFPDNLPTDKYSEYEAKHYIAALLNKIYPCNPVDVEISKFSDNGKIVCVVTFSPQLAEKIGVSCFQAEGPPLNLFQKINLALFSQLHSI